MTTCKGCGKEILWVVTVRGKMPLDPRPPVYEIGEEVNGVLPASRIPRCYVSHFATCPKANDFSASKKKGWVPPRSGGYQPNPPEHSS